MFSTSNAVASSGRDAMTMSRSSLRIRCTQSIVFLALLAGSHGEVVVVLVLEVAGLVRPQTGKRVRDGRRLQADGRDGLEIHGVSHRHSRTPEGVQLRRQTCMSGLDTPPMPTSELGPWEPLEAWTADHHEVRRTAVPVVDQWRACARAASRAHVAIARRHRHRGRPRRRGPWVKPCPTGIFASRRRAHSHRGRARCSTRARHRTMCGVALTQAARGYSTC